MIMVSAGGFWLLVMMGMFVLIDGVMSKRMHDAFDGTVNTIQLIIASMSVVFAIGTVITLALYAYSRFKLKQKQMKGVYLTKAWDKQALASADADATHVAIGLSLSVMCVLLWWATSV